MINFIKKLSNIIILNPIYNGLSTHDYLVLRIPVLESILEGISDEV